MKMKIVNLTPHALNIRQNNGLLLSVEPSGIVARCQTTKRVVDWLTDDLHPDDVPHIQVRKTEYGAVEGIPAEESGTIYVTSMLAAQAARRGDVLFPGEAIRDANGNIVGCDGLSKF